MPVRGEERGVAMVTVLLVAAALTVLATTAAFTTISELRSGRDDRRGTEAFSYAESGIDRFLSYMKSEGVTWQSFITAGCENAAGLALPPGIVGDGKFSAVLKVYEANPPSGNAADRFAPGACAYRAADPNDPQGQLFVITSRGSGASSKRVVQQIVKVSPLGLPVGIYAPAIDAGGTPSMSGISMITEGQIRGRDKLTFTGIDPYYHFADVFPGGVVGHSPADHVPAAAHALGGIFLKQNGTGPEFPPAKNCVANGAGGQSLWDSDGSSGSGAISSGCSGQTGYPLSSKFTPEIMEGVRPAQLTEEDHSALRDVARAYGIYCSIGTTTQCWKNGQASPMATTWQDGDIASLFAAGRNNFVAYFDFLAGDPLSNKINWKADVWPCDPTDPTASKSAVIVVRRGGLEIQAAKINGALIMDGALKYNGGPTINGTIISGSAFSITGNATFTLDECWVQNMPAPLLSARPVGWSEIDR